MRESLSDSQRAEIERIHGDLKSVVGTMEASGYDLNVSWVEGRLNEIVADVEDLLLEQIPAERGDDA